MARQIPDSRTFVDIDLELILPISSLPDEWVTQVRRPRALSLSCLFQDYQGAEYMRMDHKYPFSELMCLVI